MKTNISLILKLMIFLAVSLTSCNKKNHYRSMDSIGFSDLRCKGDIYDLRIYRLSDTRKLQSKFVPVILIKHPYKRNYLEGLSHNSNGLQVGEKLYPQSKSPIIIIIYDPDKNTSQSLGTISKEEYESLWKATFNNKKTAIEKLIAPLVAKSKKQG